MIRRPREFTLFPYTTLFRSHGGGEALGLDRLADGERVGEGPRHERERRAHRPQLVARDLVVGEHVRDQGVGGVEVEDRLERRSEEHTSELQSRQYLVCRLLL